MKKNAILIILSVFYMACPLLRASAMDTRDQAYCKSVVFSELSSRYQACVVELAQLRACLRDNQKTVEQLQQEDQQAFCYNRAQEAFVKNQDDLIGHKVPVSKNQAGTLVVRDELEYDKAILRDLYEDYVALCQEERRLQVQSMLKTQPYCPALVSRYQ